MKPQAIIVDIDGTMALKGDRDPYDMESVFNDEPNDFVINTVHGLRRSGLKVIFCSGRFESARLETMRWLEAYAPFSYAALLMRADGDKRPDDVLKREFYVRDIEPHYDVVGVLDDRDKVVKMWRDQLGLICFQVAWGNF